MSAERDSQQVSTGTKCVLEYDLDPPKRNNFYRYIWSLFGKKKEKGERSTQSVLIFDDVKTARKVRDVARKYGWARLWEGCREVPD